MISILKAHLTDRRCYPSLGSMLNKVSILMYTHAAILPYSSPQQQCVWAGEWECACASLLYCISLKIMNDDHLSDVMWYHYEARLTFAIPPELHASLERHKHANKDGVCLYPAPFLLPLSLNFNIFVPFVMQAEDSQMILSSQ